VCSCTGLGKIKNSSKACLESFVTISQLHHIISIVEQWKDALFHSDTSARKAHLEIHRRKKWKTDELDGDGIRVQYLTKP